MADDVGNKTEPANSENRKRSTAKTIAARVPTKNAARSKKKKTITKGGGTRARRTFPKRTLQDALLVAAAIEEKNSGNPWPPDEVARACGVSRKSSAFYDQTAAARDYGLTEGTRDSPEITLTATGRSIVLPESTQERSAGLRAAFHKVELFKKVDDHYGAKPLPESQYFDSLIQKQFGVAKDAVEEFRLVFTKNREFLAAEGVRPLSSSAPTANSATNLAEHKSPGIHTQVSSHSRDAFVIMPFGEKGILTRPAGFFKEVLRQIIVPAGDSAEFNVHTAMQSGSDVIQSTIVEHLIKADLVIADLTDHNPNVLFELGVRIALDKPIVLIRAEGTVGIFDVDNLMRVESYDPLLWVDTVKQDIQKLSRHIADGWTRRETNRRYMEILAGVNWRK